MKSVSKEKDNDTIYNNSSSMVNKPSVPIKPPKPVPASRYGDFEKLFMLFIFIRKISNVIQILYLYIYVDYLR